MNTPSSGSRDPHFYLPPSISKEMLRGVIDTLPLILALFPWGVLVGTMSIEVGFTQLEGVAMSAFVFAGAAQLVTFSMVKTGAGVLTILISVFFITIQHLLYGLTLREQVSPLKAKYRVVIGFLLTDELFALIANRTKGPFNFYYAFAAGFSFYLFWLLFTIIGVTIASSIGNLDAFHLDFSIVATFVAIIVPMVKNRPTTVGVLVSLVLSMLLSYLHIPGAIICAGLAGMLSAALCHQWGGRTCTGC